MAVPLSAPAIFIGVGVVVGICWGGGAMKNPLDAGVSLGGIDQVDEALTGGVSFGAESGVEVAVAGLVPTDTCPIV